MKIWDENYPNESEGNNLRGHHGHMVWRKPISWASISGWLSPEVSDTKQLKCGSPGGQRRKWVAQVFLSKGLGMPNHMMAPGTCSSPLPRQWWNHASPSMLCKCLWLGGDFQLNSVQQGRMHYPFTILHLDRNPRQYDAGTPSHPCLLQDCSQ